MENRIKEHENDRYLTTEDGEVYDRLESSFIKNVEKINTYEKMPNDDSDHLLREFTYPAGNAFQTHKGTVIGHNFSLTFQQINQVRSALSRLTTRTDTLQRENEEMRTLCHEAYEIYAGMEGGIAETAYEGYLLQELEKIAMILGKAKPQTQRSERDG